MLFLGMAVARSPTIELAIAAKKPCMFCITKASRRLDQSVQHCRQSECRPADDFQHISGCGLILPCFVQLATQPRNRCRIAPLRRFSRAPLRLAPFAASGARSQSLTQSSNREISPFKRAITAGICDQRNGVQGRTAATLSRSCSLRVIRGH
jgi:hypothetical protein